MENRVSSAGFWRNLRMKPFTNAGYETEMQNAVQRTYRVKLVGELGRKKPERWKELL
jgi:hypothetical protein